MSFKWGQVTDRAERVAVVASGPSLRHVSLSRLEGRATVICVNDMALHEKWCDYAFTLDSNVLLYRMRLYGGRQKIAAVPENYLQADARKRGWQQLPLNKPPVTFLKRQRADQMSDDSGVIGHANHSGSGALNLAFHLQPKKLLLLGMDHRNLHQYCYGDGREARRPWEHDLDWYRRAAEQFAQAGCEVINGSAESRIDAWDRMDPVTAMDWLVGN